MILINYNLILLLNWVTMQKLRKQYIHRLIALISYFTFD